MCSNFGFVVMAQGLGLPIRTLEVEFGSKFRLKWTFDPRAKALEQAD